jgi:molybdopterin-guanine dinucleotide biosynthesis protein A
MPDADLSQCTLAILAGGEGSRMGRPKGELEIAGKPILVWLLERFEWPGPTLLVTAPGREHPPGWERFDREVVDAVAGEGPLRGVLTAVEGVETEIVVVATVDMPAVTREQFVWLADLLAATPERLAVMYRRSVERIEPFPLGVRRKALGPVRALIASGERSVVRGLIQGVADVVACPGDWPDETWINLNWPEDLDQLGPSDAAGKPAG